jgi:hypothetical protein
MDRLLVLSTFEALYEAAYGKPYKRSSSIVQAVLNLLDQAAGGDTKEVVRRIKAAFCKLKADVGEISLSVVFCRWDDLGATL